MRAKLIYIVCLTLSAVTLRGQESNKPQMSNITALPSEPVSPSGNCAVSHSGYLEKDGRTKMTKAEIGEFVDSSLRDGYVLTIYPETKRGIFVNMECVTEKNPAAPKAP